MFHPGRSPGYQGYRSLPLAAGIQNIHGNRSLTPGRRQQNWKAPFCFYISSSVNWQLGASLSSIRLGCTFLPSFVSSFHLCRSQPRLRNFSNMYFSFLQLLLHLSRSTFLKHSWLCTIFLNKTKHHSPIHLFTFLQKHPRFGVPVVQITTGTWFQANQVLCATRSYKTGREIINTYDFVMKLSCSIK